MLANDLMVFVDILEVHLLDFSLESLLLLVQLVHVFAHEFLNVDVLVACAPCCLVTARIAACWTDPSAPLLHCI